MTSELQDRAKGRFIIICTALIALLHCALWFAHYGASALGESPALDNRQILLLAQHMAEGTLANEPFHRAPLYPFILSLFIKLGFPLEAMPIIARWLNAIALAVCASASACIAGRLWGKACCAWAAGLLVALNPVLVFFAGDAFDILLATACLLPAIALLQSWLREQTLRNSLAIGLLMALGSALRSHLLPLALLWPIASLILTNRGRPAHCIAATAPLLLSLVLLGVANQKLTGEFRVMPWQGAYNLWAGNRPDASGRIYAQSIRVDFDRSYDNPAKLESIALYEKATGENAPHSIDAMNAHWKAKFLDHVFTHPLAWTGLMLRKAYYFLNNYEQYDNKTYGFHRRLYPQLKYNPIHWGLLLTLSVAAAFIGLRDSYRRKLIISSIIIFAVYAAGTILFYTSNRFRVPMVPMLASVASGSLLLPLAWQKASKLWKAGLIASMILAATIAYSGFFKVRDNRTWEEDHALLANASLRTGRDSQAIAHANAALKMNRNRPDMFAVLSQAQFSQWALSESPISQQAAEEYLQHTKLGATHERHLQALAGIYHWKLAQKHAAVATWQRIAETDALARLCLYWTGYQSKPTEGELLQYHDHPSHALLVAASGASADKPVSGRTTRFIDTLLSPAVTTE
ncbi:MAG: ArnT family glycosyltransferase [Opitutales bacterium]